jgi:hypothetical protein
MVLTGGKKGQLVSLIRRQLQQEFKTKTLMKRFFPEMAALHLRAPSPKRKAQPGQLAQLVAASWKAPK